MLETHIPISEEKLNPFKTAEDVELQFVMKAVQVGWPEQFCHVLTEMKNCWTFREELSCSEGLVFKNTRHVVSHRLTA